MSTPVPAPRKYNTTDKKPIPAPRELVPIRPSRTRDNVNDNIDKVEVRFTDNKSEVNSNTFTKRVKTFGSASKQFAGDIGGKVQEGKKAVIESTRSSVRRLTKRFHSVSSDLGESTEEDIKNRDLDIPVDIFNSIKFNSPINMDATEPIYLNVTVGTNEEDDEYNRPPPPYPPPPLREESLYDEPQSIASGSSNSSSSGRTRNNCVYESVFPMYPYNSDSESCADSTRGHSENHVPLNRSESWKFYDQVPKVEQIYNNVDNTPALNPRTREFPNETGTNSTNSPVSLMDDNNLYQNFDITTRESYAISRKPTESVMMQFDPLSNSTSAPDINSNLQNKELDHLQQLLLGDLYSNTNFSTIDNWSISNESETEDYISPPPPPPQRFDSLPDEQSPVLPRRESRSNWYTDSESAENNNVPQKTTSSIGKQLFKQVNGVLKRAPHLVKGGRGKDTYLLRPAITSKTSHHHKGLLYKVTNGPVEDLFGEFNSRWCILEGQLFLCHLDSSCNTIKENFPLESILSIQILQDQKYKYKYDNEDIHCFELNTSGKSRGGHVYGSKSQSERRVWMQKLAESLTYRFGSSITSDFQRMGWTYLREGVSGQWLGAWVILSNRTLHYVIDNASVKSIDLRKARCIILQPYREGDGSPKTTDKGPNMLIDCQSGSVYFRMWTSRETKVWCHIVRLAAHNNGLRLEQQQLTKSNIPVIVEKCINFIYVYGSMSKGIYRVSGTSSNVNEILTQFRTDAWSTQLTQGKYSEHEVATALKRFFRDLPEPLMPKDKQEYFHQVSLVKDRQERIRMYKAAFDQFSKIHYNTIRKLLGHLHFIVSQSDKNQMTVDNIASLWGVTLMNTEARSNEGFNHKDNVLVADLINLYTEIFPENPKEMEQERVMLVILQKYSNQPHGNLNNAKVSGEFRVWIYLHNKKGETYNIAIGPQKTAYEVCSELSLKINLPVHELVLEELVLNDNLIRPIHYTEKVLDIVLKWGYWDEADRKDNCLILSAMEKYNLYIIEATKPIEGELRFADSKSRNFRAFMFAVSHGNLSCYKDKLCKQLFTSWKIEDIIWYLGHEPKRSPPSKHTITFISKDGRASRSKSAHWFGNVLAFTDEAFKVLWVGTMWKTAHPREFLPPAQHVNIMNT